ncbi:MAG TPA: decaprenyl-phosphate phosphoribosyltransferase [Dissulfurispiraceae bacterium]
MNGIVRNYSALLRPKHWIKNLFLFAAPFFGGRLFEEHTASFALPAFLAFSFCASAVYIFNDVMDVEADKLHPKKMRRPVASGAVGRRSAFAIAGLLAASSFALSSMISLYFALFIFIYLLIQVSYSAFLKKIALLDIFCISSGFVLRVLAGGAAFDVKVSQWLLLTMFTVSLAFGAGKRLSEFVILSGNAVEHRESLNGYSVATLSDIFLVAASSALVSYALYTIEQAHQLAFTVPIVTFSLFRYLILSRKGMGDPIEALSKDKWLALSVTVWLILIGVIRYN